VTVDAMQAAVGGVVVASGGIALYVRLRFKSFVIETLNGRYQTKELAENQFNALIGKIDTLSDTVGSRINDLPCRHGGVCQAPHEKHPHTRHHLPYTGDEYGDDT